MKDPKYVIVFNRDLYRRQTEVLNWLKNHSVTITYKEWFEIFGHLHFYVYDDRSFLLIVSNYKEYIQSVQTGYEWINGHM